MSNILKCKHCKKLLSEDALYTLNRIALSHGYCCWVCLTKALSPETVNKMLQDRAKIKKLGGYGGPRKKDQKYSEHSKRTL